MANSIATATALTCKNVETDSFTQKSIIKKKFLQDNQIPTANQETKEKRKLGIIPNQCRLISTNFHIAYSNPQKKNQTNDI